VNITKIKKETPMAVRPTNMIAILENRFRLRLTKNSDPRNIVLFTKYKAVDIIELGNKKKKGDKKINESKVYC